MGHKDDGWRDSGCIEARCVAGSVVRSQWSSWGGGFADVHCWRGWRRRCELGPAFASQGGRSSSAKWWLGQLRHVWVESVRFKFRVSGFARAYGAELTSAATREWEHEFEQDTNRSAARRLAGGGAAAGDSRSPGKSMSKITIKRGGNYGCSTCNSGASLAAITASARGRTFIILNIVLLRGPAWRHITEAVRNMPYGIQQPAISGQVAALEEHLGVALFSSPALWH